MAGGHSEGLEGLTSETPLKDTGLPPSPPIDGRTLSDPEAWTHWLRRMDKLAQLQGLLLYTPEALDLEEFRKGMGKSGGARGEGDFVEAPWGGAELGLDRRAAQSRDADTPLDSFRPDSAVPPDAAAASLVTRSEARRILCQARRRGAEIRAQGEDLPSAFVFPAWAGQVDRSHSGLRYVGGVLGCTRCAGFASTVATNSPLKKLARPCKGFVPAGSQSRLNLFLRGMLPSPWNRAEAWPDERAPSTEPRWPIHLLYRDGAWHPSLADSDAG